MICSDCGHNNTETSTFCVICGAQLIKADVFRAGDYSKKPVEKKEQGVVFPGAGIKEETRDGQTIHDGRYLLLEKLGEGGMGKIYLARDTKMDSKVVIKELLPIFITHAEREYLDKRFREEAKILFRLDYRGLPKVIDFFSEEKKMYIVMQYVDGENLMQMVKKRPSQTITTDECLLWMTRLLDIIDYLHSQEPPIIHRDIKPKNIMINNRGEIYLVDFGLARTLSSMTKTNTSVGTFGYSSPEHYSGKFELSSDIYSLGATFHHLLSGDDPQHRDTFDYPPLSKYIPDFPPDLQKIFNRMLNMKKSSRFPTVKELKVALNEYLETLNQTNEFESRQKQEEEDIPEMTLDLMGDEDEDSPGTSASSVVIPSQGNSMGNKSDTQGRPTSVVQKRTSIFEKSEITPKSTSQKSSGESGKTPTLQGGTTQEEDEEESVKMEKETEFFLDDDDDEDKVEGGEILTLAVEEDDIPETSEKVEEMPVAKAAPETRKEAVPPLMEEPPEEISEEDIKTEVHKTQETLPPIVLQQQKKEEPVKTTAEKVRIEKKPLKEPVKEPAKKPLKEPIRKPAEEPAKKIEKAPPMEEGKKKPFPVMIMIVILILGALAAGAFFGKDMLFRGVAKSSPTIDVKTASPEITTTKTETVVPAESPSADKTPKPAMSTAIVEPTVVAPSSEPSMEEPSSSPSAEVPETPDQPDKGVLLISSESGAESIVIYDSTGKQQSGKIRLHPGRTDQPVPLEPGEYSVKFSRIGYYTIVKKSMKIEAGEKFEMGKGSLEWISLPELIVQTNKEAKIDIFDMAKGAKVVNNAPTARTGDGKYTFKLDRMQDSTYKVVAKRKGHYDDTKKVVLKGGGEKTVSLELKPIPRPVYRPPQPVYVDRPIYRPAPRIPRDPVKGK